jgi:hypothetical protein
MLHRRCRIVCCLSLALLGLACGPSSDRGSESPPGSGDSGDSGTTAEAVAVMDAVAPQYVKLVLALGEHDSGYVDAYYGPAEWRQEMTEAALTLEQIAEQAATQLAALAAVAPGPEGPDADEIVRLRHSYLVQQLQALAAYGEILQGATLSFEEEAKALYGVEVPVVPEAHFEAAQEELEAILPGDGTLAERLETFRQGFVIPAEKLDAVFRAAIDACRERTVAHLTLPETESFTVEYVTDKPWSGYNWYQGEYRSLIQVNTDLPIFIDRAIDLACHEGYPGHHTYNALLEKNLVRDRGWVEMSVYPLFSPQSLIAEGSANFGIEMAFPGEERVRFERDVLFPLAGLDPATAAAYYRVQDIVQGMSYGSNEAARRYLNGEITAEEAAAWLVRYALLSPERAAQRVKFIDTYRSYVINYNLGLDLVRAYVEAQGGTPDQPERRWQVFGALLSSPRLPGDLQ